MNTSRTEEMLNYVPNYYKNSKYYLAHNNAKGKEFDIIRIIIDDMSNQFNPQTATWGLKFFEELYNIEPSPTNNVEKRRAEIIKEGLNDKQITPYSLEKMVKAILGSDISIIRDIRPYTFQVVLNNMSNVSDVWRLIEDYKEAHTQCKLDYEFYESSMVYSGAAIIIEDSLEIRQVN